MQPERRSLLSLALAAGSSERFISDDQHRIAIHDLDGGSRLRVALDRFRDRVVLLATKKQLPTVLALIELDGIARRVLLATPDLHMHLPWIMDAAQVDYVVTDAGNFEPERLVGVHAGLVHSASNPGRRNIDTEWVLFTSGTTGRPKMVVHTLSSLIGPLNDDVVVPNGTVWSTFYDVRRYGGLQILLRAMMRGGSLALSDADEPVRNFLRRVAAVRTTHISGTPSHWRRALMSDVASTIAPEYIRLSGEVADQPLLDSLRRAFPGANIAHAFASTEAGVAFDVRDGLAGFPASFLTEGPIEMRIIDGTLQIRSSRTASRYLGQPLRQADGFIDTGDLVEQRGDRVYFMGRREGVINVGGLKIYPEEVEAVLTQHPDVRMARVWPRKSPITGTIVAADVAVGPEAAQGFADLRKDLMQMCRASLAPHKVPATWRQVDLIDITASGKVCRV
jgi:acyl-coenzyme A synthetase/AMP-(fatty) acid ligase